jgi:formylglycine-generating enzyme required for sulfatase activity
VSGELVLEGVSASGALGTSLTADTRLRFNLRSTSELAQSLFSVDTAVQANLASRNDLRQGEVLAQLAVDALVAELQKMLAFASLVGVDPGMLSESKENLLNGLQYLAPYIAQGEGAALWKLVADTVDINKPTDPKLRALWGDVRHALGCDDRFDAQNLYLLKDRFTGHSVQDEPLTGFVRVPAGSFTMGGKGDADDNPPLPRTIDNPFYISRTLVTVDQYAAFIRDGGYADGSSWWDKQGIDWRNGSFDSKVKNDDYQKHLARRAVALRSQPMQWDEQKALGSRPVWGVNWFEARAYARWLNAQLAPGIGQALGAGYAAMLPTERQWDRAARAVSLTQADGRTWPWGNQEFDAERHANLNGTIGGVCTVGLFPPNPIGLHDLAGNQREWMDNLYEAKGGDFNRVDRDSILLSHEWLQNSDLPALLGSSWIDTPDDARCYFRRRSLPVACPTSIGFRVVLSLAN